MVRKSGSPQLPFWLQAVELCMDFFFVIKRR